MEGGLVIWELGSLKEPQGGSGSPWGVFTYGHPSNLGILIAGPKNLACRSWIHSLAGGLRACLVINRLCRFMVFASTEKLYDMLSPFRPK